MTEMDPVEKPPVETATPPVRFRARANTRARPMLTPTLTPYAITTPVKALSKSIAEIDRSMDAPSPPGVVRSGHNAARLLHSRLGNIGTASSIGSSLTKRTSLCYGSRLALPSIPNLGPRPEFPNWSSTTASILSTTFGEICHELYAPAITLLLLSVLPLGAQIFTPPLPGAPQTAQPSGNPNHRAAPPRPNIPGKDEIHIETSLPSGQEKIGHVYHLRGDVRIETTDELLKADEVDYDEESGDAEARGHVHFEHFARGEKLDCDRAEYNFDSEEGKFYNVSGSSPSQVQARPGLLTTQNPFYFQAKWAERLNGHYILYSGFVTDCIVPRPWWRLRGPKFDLIPGDRAVTRDSWFYLKSLPLFYTPYFYKSLKKVPRRSGFLLPNTANSSLHGRGIGLGYFWAINRSFDLTYRAQYFSQAGLGNHAELRGKINQKTDFDLWVDGIKDQQTPDPGDSGFRIRMIAKSQLGDGWEARGSLDYLSNFAFVQSFTQSFYEAVSSQSESVGFATKHWSDFGLTIAATRDVNFQSTAPGDTIEVRKLPEIDFTEREHEIDLDKFPVWFSFDSTAGLLDRSQPLFQTHQFVQRIDLAPHVTTAFHWHDFSLVPTFGIRETEYGESVATQAIDGGQGVQPPGPISVDNLIRSSRDLQVELIFPSLERIFKPPKWMGDKVKHVIEPRIVYKYVNGVDNFNDIVRFDESDILTNTNQLELSVTNHLLSKDKNGTVVDFLSWQVRYDRYFDPSFGGVVQTPIAGQTPQRYVIDASSDLTGFAFIDGPRNYSPIVSVVRIQPGPQPINFEWRTDYDPMFHRLTNSSVSVDGRIKKYFWGVTHTDINTDPALTPRANQIGTRFGYGNPNSRGWNFGGTLNYDYLKGQTLFWEAQATKNTDCCGFSVQYRRIAVGLRGESVIEGAFAISNIGTFGSLKRQDSIF